MRNNIIKRSVFLIVFCIIAMAIFSVIAKYDIKGEQRMPYGIEKILLVSTVDGKKNEDENNVWNIGITQVNDVYIYVKKLHETDVVIESVILNNFSNTELYKNTNLSILRPTGDLSNLYSKSQENYISKDITYLGGTIDNLKGLEIGNEGGMIGFRASLSNFGNFVSNNDEEVIYDGRLLSNLGVKEEDLKFNLSFDITINTSDGVEYIGTESITLPVNNFMENGSANEIITDFSNLIFKRY